MDTPNPDVQTQVAPEPPVEPARQAPEKRAAASTRAPSIIVGVVAAARAIGDHDRNTLRLRLDPQDRLAGFEPGMTVSLNR